MLSSAIRFCKSSPLCPGSRKSNTKQLVTSSRELSRNSWAEEKVKTLKPTERIKLTRDSRTDSSSSTTNTKACSFCIALLLMLRESKLKCCAGTVRHGPQFSALIFNNRSANCQTHSQSLRFGRIERIKDLFQCFLVDTNT